MVNFKININPNQKDISFTIEGDFDDIDLIDIEKVKKLNKKIKTISQELQFNITDSSLPKKNTPAKITLNPKTNSSVSEPSLLNVPEHLKNKIESVAEKVKFPILWSFCSNPVMTIEEFLTECSAKGFALSTSWLPSVGGNFSNKLVTENKMFKKAGTKNLKKAWTFSSVGKLKVQQLINNLKNPASETNK